MSSRASRLVTRSPLYAEWKRTTRSAKFFHPPNARAGLDTTLLPIPGFCMEVEGPRCQYGHLHLSSLTLKIQH